MQSKKYSFPCFVVLLLFSCPSSVNWVIMFGHACSCTVESLIISSHNIFHTHDTSYLCWGPYQCEVCWRTSIQIYGQVNQLFIWWNWQLARCCFSVCCSSHSAILHTEHPGSATQRDPGKGPLGSYSVPGQKWPGTADLTNNGVRLTQLWIMFHVYRTLVLSDLRYIGIPPSWLWPQWTLSGSKFDPGVFRV